MSSVRRVRCLSFLAMVLIHVGSLPMRSQTNRLQDLLNSSYKSKVLLLRNFYSEKELEYDQNGVVRGPATQGPWTLANVEIRGITVTAQGIEIVGNRMGTWFRDGKPSFVNVGKLKIQVARPASDVDTEGTLHSIFGRIFIEPGEDLRPMLPEYWSYYLDGTDSTSRSAAWRGSWQKNNIPPSKAAEVTSKAGVVTSPRVVYAPDPKYTNEAKSRHIEGYRA